MSRPARPTLVSSSLPSSTAIMLTEPIDDPDAKDPLSIHEARAGIYWAHWIATLYEELKALKAKEVYRNIDTIPEGRKPVNCKWVLHIK